MKANVDGQWIRCGKCGHKLMRMIDDGMCVVRYPAFEIKCHSCKAINGYPYNIEHVTKEELND